MQRTVLVLANSNKPGGRCLAGRFIERAPNGRWKTGDWCRPVFRNGNGHDAIPTEACGDVNPLDVVSIELDVHSPAGGQPENWQWRPNTAINVVHTFNNIHNALASRADSPVDLWLDQNATRADEVNQHQPIAQSLYLIQPTELWMHLSLDEQNRKHVHAEFAYQGWRYDGIPVTDPIIKRILSKQFPADGATIRMQLHHAAAYWLTLSLSLPFGPRQARYKLVAAVIDHTGYLQRTYR